MPTAARFATLPRNVAIVAAFNTAIAVALAASGRGGLGESFVYSQCIGLAILLSIDVTRRLMWGPAAPPRRAFLALAAAGVVTGFLAGGALAAQLTGRNLMRADSLAGTLAVTLFAGVAGIWYFLNRERMAKLRLQAETVERGAAEARLKLLQAQIEPHFLFNTLANLHSLIGTDPARAQKMLEHLNDYLRATLAAARSEAATLGEEFSLLRGYLEILAIRMGSRLDFSLSLPEELSGLRIPPMLLQPLVENAVKHGLEPKIEGGRVEVEARREGDCVVIRVSDTGLGEGSAGGTGVGLAHVRERLTAVYGQKADLRMQRNPKGVTVTVTIPA